MTDAGATDGGPTDAGATDAGPTDAGTPCNASDFYPITIDAPPFILSVDGVVGLPSKVSVRVWPEPALSCLSGKFTGPNGVSGPVVVTHNSKPSKFDFAFTPKSVGRYTVDLTIDTSLGPTTRYPYDGKLANTIEVFPRAAPLMLLGRSCDSVIQAAGMIGCDDQLFTQAGVAYARLEGGRWFGAGHNLFAWKDGGVSRAEISDGGVVFSATTPSPFPESWASTNEVLAVATTDGGRVFQLDAGAISPIGELGGSAVITVFKNGIVSLAGVSNPCGSAVGCQWVFMRIEQPFDQDAFELSVADLVSANASSFCRFGHFAYYPNAITCESATLGADGGIAVVPESSGTQFGLPETNGRYHFWSRHEPISRRPLIETSQGVRLPGSSAMVLEGAERISSTDDFVWQSSATETAIWK